MRRGKKRQEEQAERISIHAPLTGCDIDKSKLIVDFIDISIHAPLTGCDMKTCLTGLVINQFQSTHPLRDATKSL